MKPTSPLPQEDPVRAHTYDGIQEYDKHLPNWWLYTLYITMVFSLGYWACYEWMHLGHTGAQNVELAMAKIAAERLSVAKLDDATLWQMSRNPTFVASGQATFESNCVACHLATLRGKSENATAIGPDLTDKLWIHGGKPTEIHATIANGVLVKGMPTWGPVLGAKKITEVAAYILSKHKDGEEIVLETTPKL